MTRAVPRTRRPAALPVVAALAVLALLAGCTSSGSGAAPTSSAPTPTSGSSVSTSATAAPASHQASSSASRTSAAKPGGAGGAVRLSGVRVADVTFVGSQGWLLGTADCLSGSGTNCTAIEHSTDGGRTWRSMRAPAGLHVAVPSASGSTADCAEPCVDGIRYASATVGYLFGGGTNGSLYFTTDGGSSWRPLPGDADGLEAADGTALHVVDTGACPPGCRYAVAVSPTGTMQSHQVALPGRGNDGDGALFARSGPNAYLLSLGHVSGGGDTAHSVLWTSSNDGSSWTNRGEPCPQHGREYDSALLSAAPDGAVAVLCRGRAQPYAQFVITGPPGGAHFTAARLSALGAARVTALGAVSASTVLVSSDETYRSTDGGNRFSRLSANAGSSPGQVGYLGFASATVGHAISTDRATIWNTTDGGRTWARASLG